MTGTLFDKPTVKLSRQQQSILDALRSGRKSNVELNAICFRYGARIFELRKLGYRIEIVARGEHGVRWYELRESG